LAKAPGLILDENFVAQEFNLEELLGVDLSSDESLAEEIGQDIVDFIQERAINGQGIGGKELRSPYSKSYSTSGEFIAAGKDENEVNMTLTGDMIESISVIDFRDNVLTVGIEGPQAPKAHGHMTGKNGTVPKMKREFFGLSKAEIEEITDRYQDRVDEIARSEASLESLLSESENAAIDRAFDTIGDLFNFEQES
jgi:hypothetical protein